MAEYIEREALIETFEEWKENFEMYPPECSESVVMCDVVQKIRDFPSTDVVPKSEVEKIFEGILSLIKAEKFHIYAVGGEGKGG